jgi:phosphatidylserine decarboxylase
VNQTIQHVDKHPKELLPVIKELKEMVEKDSRLWMLFNAMFDQVRPVRSTKLWRLRCS